MGSALGGPVAPDLENLRHLVGSHRSLGSRVTPDRHRPFEMHRTHALTCPISFAKSATSGSMSVAERPWASASRLLHEYQGSRLGSLGVVSPGRRVDTRMIRLIHAIQDGLGLGLAEPNGPSRPLTECRRIHARLPCDQPAPPPIHGHAGSRPHAPARAAGIVVHTVGLESMPDAVVSVADSANPSWFLQATRASELHIGLAGGDDTQKLRWHLLLIPSLKLVFTTSQEAASVRSILNLRGSTRWVAHLFRGGGHEFGYGIRVPHG